MKVILQYTYKDHLPILTGKRIELTPDEQKMKNKGMSYSDIINLKSKGGAKKRNSYK